MRFKRVVGGMCLRRGWDERRDEYMKEGNAICGGIEVNSMKVGGRVADTVSCKEKTLQALNGVVGRRAETNPTASFIESSKPEFEAINLCYPNPKKLLCLCT